MRRHQPDHYIILFAGILLLIGLIVIYSVGPALNYQLVGDYSQNFFLYRQVINIAVALVGFTVAAMLPSQAWIKLLPVLLIATVIANLLLLVPGAAITQNGATRWLGFGGLSFQPVELLKLTAVIYFAKLLSMKNSQEYQDYKEVLVPSGIILAGLSLVIVLLQNDMGSMLVVAAIIVGMLFVAGMPWRHLAVLVGGFSAFGALSVVLFPHRVTRFLTFLNPGSDLEGAGYHVQQVLIAIGSGGLAGLGFGRSIQSYGYIPESANDSIFAIFAEKFGFVGGVVLISLFVLLLARVFRTGLRLEDKFQQLLVMGVLIWLGSHIIINVGAMLAIMPLTGITLPFISYGGSSLLFIMVGLGIVYQASRYTTHRDKSVKPSGRKVRRAPSWSRV